MLTNAELIEKYPFLAVEDPYEPDNWVSCWLDDLEPGWRAAFGERLCEDLVKALKEDNCEDEFKFEQIKEKYGSLRLYASGYGEHTKHVLAKYEELSKYICGHCGKVARYVTSGWIYPLCEECMLKVNSYRVPIEEFYGVETYEDIQKEIDSIQTNFVYDKYWTTVK